jgi:hypothetical protein
MAYKQSTNPFKRTIGGVEIPDSQYKGVRGKVAARRKKRAKRVADKALSRQVEGKRVSKRQQRLMDENQYNVDRQEIISKARKGKKAATQARKSESLKPGAKTDANSVSAKQQSVLDQYGFDPKNTKADMPAVDVSPREAKTTRTGGRRTNIVNPEGKGPTRQYYTERDIPELNRKSREAGPDEYGLTMSYKKGKDGKYTKTYSTKDSAKSEAAIRAAYTKQFGTDAVFPTDRGGSLSDAVKNLKGLT